MKWLHRSEWVSVVLTVFALAIILLLATVMRYEVLRSLIATQEALDTRLGGIEDHLHEQDKLLDALQSEKRR